MLAQNFRNKTVSYLSLCFVLFCGACKSRTKANLNNSNKYIETPADSFGNKGLIWGSFFHFGESITADNFQKIILSNKYKNLAKQSARSCEKMKSDFGLTFEAIENFSFESVLPSVATFKASNVAGMEIERIYMSAVCAATSQNLDERKKALENASAGIEKWTKKYVVQGNPINEVKLLQLVHSFDLVNSAVPEELKFAMANFAKAIILAEDNFYLGKETPKTKRIENFANDSRVWNNWQTWRIALRASAAGFLHDSAELKKTKIVIDEMFEKNLPQNSPGFDFEHRDALLYHVYNLQAWINIAWYTPYLLSASQLSRIEQAVFVYSAILPWGAKSY